MITSVSALLNRKTRASVLTDDLRGQAIYRMRKSGMLLQDTSEVLNCSRRVVSTLLVPQFHAQHMAGISSAGNDSPDLDSMSSNELCLALYRAPVTDQEVARERQRVARHLAAEVRRWLSAFEVRDLDRRVAIEQAGLGLDHSPFNSAGEYVFEVDRAVSEALDVWKPRTPCRSDRELDAELGRWLACWIRFWVADPAIWNRALDLEYQFFGGRAEADEAA